MLVQIDIPDNAAEKIVNCLENIKITDFEVSSTISRFSRSIRYQLKRKLEKDASFLNKIDKQ